jgi:bleomycin hydrolase
MNVQPITDENLKAFDGAYRADPVRRAMTDVLYRCKLDDLVHNPQRAREMHFAFSVDIPTMKCADQKHSGRCWLFAATNCLREKLGKQINVEQLELSQSWLAFWDKFERCNYFFESVLDTAALPVSDRTVHHIFEKRVEDGGQWDMFVNIVDKYGLVPQSAYPETEQSSDTGSENDILGQYLRKCGAILRRDAASGMDAWALQDEKSGFLSKIYGFLVGCYGEPCRTFDFEYVDKDKKYHVERGLTPASFRDKYFGDSLHDYISLINAPTADKPYDRTYTVKYLGNVAGGRSVLYLNLPMAELKAAVIRQLRDGEVVWFGSDCSKCRDRKMHQWDHKGQDIELLTGLDADMTKADSLDTCQSAMNHAMVITGVNLGADGKPDRWKVENSWGTEGANDGYYMATDGWFDQFVYQAVVQKKYLNGKEKLLDQKPVELEPWDPMGTLAD